MLTLNEYKGRFLNQDGYYYGEMPRQLSEQFGETVVKTVHGPRNIWYTTETGITVSSNGYVAE